MVYQVIITTHSERYENSAEALQRGFSGRRMCVWGVVEFLLELVSQCLLMVTPGQLIVYIYMHLAKADYAVLESL